MTSKGLKKTFKRRKRKRRNKRIFKGVICIVAAVLIWYIGHGASKIIFGSTLNNKEAQKVNHLDKIPEEVKNSKDPVIQSLLNKANNNPQVITMLNDIKSYPKDLLELAAKKDETIDFVANYPSRDTSTNKAISIKEDYKKGEIPLFIQWDERWGYEKYFSAKNGYLVEGVGSSWSLMTKGAANFGLKGKELPLSENSIITTLKKGQPIIASMGPGTFTTSGHFIVLTGVDSNNKIIVNDSDSKIKSKQAWDVDIFMKEAKNLWTFTTR